MIQLFSNVYWLIRGSQSVVLCPYHNTRKNNRRVQIAYYRTEIADAGEKMVDTIGELINLAWAYERAMQMYGRAFAVRGELILMDRMEGMGVEL